MPVEETSERHAEPARVLEVLGARAGAPALDAFADLAGAEASLRGSGSDDELLLRASGELGGGATDGGADGEASAYGPKPMAPAWVRWTHGAPEVKTSGEAAGAAVGVATRAVTRLRMDSGEVACCAAPSCTLRKTRTRVWLEMEPLPEAPRRLLVAEVVDADASKARARAGGVADALAGALGLRRDAATGRGADADAATGTETDAGTGTDTDTGTDTGTGTGAAAGAGAGAGGGRSGGEVSASALARFSFMPEGDGWVMRDHGSAGPRDRSPRLLITAAILGALAMVGWAVVARGVAGGAAGGPEIAVGIGAALLSLTAYAFLGVGRFAARYQARSNPLLWVGAARVTPMPWVARDGRVDLRPEGRFGASIALHEVREVGTPPRAGGVAVELRTDHGDIDVLVTPDRAVAELWSAALSRALVDFAHPDVKPTARQRARQAAAGKAGPHAGA